MGAEEHDGGDVAAAAGDARGRQRNAHGKAKMTPTSQVAAPPDAKGRRIHLGDSVGQREVDGRRGEGGGTDTRKASPSGPSLAHKIANSCASRRHEGGVSTVPTAA